MHAMSASVVPALKRLPQEMQFVYPVNCDRKFCTTISDKQNAESSALPKLSYHGSVSKHPFSQNCESEITNAESPEEDQPGWLHLNKAAGVCWPSGMKGAWEFRGIMDSSCEEKGCSGR